VKNKMSNELTKSEIKQSMPKEQELSFLQRKAHERRLKKLDKTKQRIEKQQLKLNKDLTAAKERRELHEEQEKLHRIKKIRHEQNVKKHEKRDERLEKAKNVTLKAGKHNLFGKLAIVPTIGMPKAAQSCVNLPTTLKVYIWIAR